MLEESNPIPSSAGGANNLPKSVLDERLVVSARSDREAFVELYRLHVASVYGYYVLRVGPAIARHRARVAPRTRMVPSPRPKHPVDVVGGLQNPPPEEKGEGLEPTDIPHSARA